jgi:hypothetical protein
MKEENDTVLIGKNSVALKAGRRRNTRECQDEGRWAVAGRDTLQGQKREGMPAAG